MADAIMTAATELSAITPSIWSRNYYDTLLATLPFNSVVSKDYEGEIQALGNIVKIATFPEFTDGEILAEDAAQEADSITVTSQDLTINQQIVKDFIITDIAMIQSLPAMDKLKELAIYSINKKIQALIIAATIPSATAPDHQIGYDSGSTLALADILEAKELLDTQNVPMSDRHMVMGAAQLNDLFNISSLTSNDYVAKGLIESGEVSSPILGFMPHFSTVAAAVVYLFHSSYLTLASQKGMTVAEHDLGVIGRRGRRVNCTVLLGLKQLDSKRVVTLS